MLRQLSEHKELWAKLGEWARDVSVDTTLVLVEAKPDKRTKAYKTLARAGEVIAAEPLTERTRSAAETWLRDLARAQGVEISRAQAANMVSRALISNETSRIAEVDQLQLAHAVKALVNVDSVTDEVIATVLPPAREFSVFDILELAARRDVRATQKALSELRATDVQGDGVIVGTVGAACGSDDGRRRFVRADRERSGDPPVCCQEAAGACAVF